MIQDTQMLLCPGYGGGVGQYARTAADFINRHPEKTVSIIDWIGIGLSYHPPSMRMDRNDDSCLLPFIESLEKWRIARGCTLLNLVGHSLGGYLCARYSALYPQNVNRLVLASCVGLPKRPEVIQDRYENANIVSKTIGRTALKFVAQTSATPFTLLRAAGPLGPVMVRKLVMERFATKCTESLPARFGDYIYHYNGLPSCGEQIVLVALDAEAYARQPLVELLANKRGVDFPPVSFIHGEFDWVFPEPSLHLIKQDVMRRNIYVVPLCGHQMFTENSHGFTEALEFALLQPVGALQPNPPTMKSPPPVSFVAGYKANRPSPVSPIANPQAPALIDIKISRPHLVCPEFLPLMELPGSVHGDMASKLYDDGEECSSDDELFESDTDDVEFAVKAFESCLPSEVAVCAIDKKNSALSSIHNNSNNENNNNNNNSDNLVNGLNRRLIPSPLNLLGALFGGLATINIPSRNTNSLLAANEDALTQVPRSEGSVSDGETLGVCEQLSPTEASFSNIRGRGFYQQHSSNK